MCCTDCSQHIVTLLGVLSEDGCTIAISLCCNCCAGRAEALRQCCSNVEVKLLQAGHCPHDEAPAAVNAALLEFLEARAVPSSV